MSGRFVALGASPTACRPALVVLATDDELALREVAAAIEASGGAVRHEFPPRAMIAAVDDDSLARLGADPTVAMATREPVAVEGAVAQWGPSAQVGVRAWNDVFAAPPHALLPASEGLPLVGDVLLSPEPIPARGLVAAAEGAPPGATIYQTSEYLLGRAAVGVVLLESNGSIDANTEDWSGDRLGQVTSEIVAGLDWWVSQYPHAVGRPSFTYTYHLGTATGYEPITRASSEQGKWMSQALTALGYPCTESDYHAAARSYVNALRESQHADWAFLVFVVDSANDVDGMFADGYFGYAYLNGPLLVMTYDNDGWGIGAMDRVLAHEVGHIFGAGDEYCSPGYSCCSPDSYYGYLNIRNSNCGTGVTCVMNQSSSAVCAVTREQLGWRDLDGDSSPDILDVAPTITLEPYGVAETLETELTFAGGASVRAYPNQRIAGADVTLNRIAGIQYRVDGGAWQPASAADGLFDEGTEDYILTTPTLGPGAHTIEVRASDTSGNLSSTPYPSDTVTVLEEHIVTVTPSILLSPICSLGSTQLSASASDTLDHAIASWWWADGGAGGTFSPAPSAQNPVYTAPPRGAELDRTITLTVVATCAGVPTTSGRGSVELAIHDFSDVPADHWAAGEIYGCYREGIVSGFPDGSYRPLLPITRDQMAAYIARGMAGGDDGVPADPHVVSFADAAADHWAYRYVEYAYANGVVGGYPDGLYHPEDSVDRGQMAVFVARAVATPTGEAGVPAAPPGEPTFPDVTAESAWAWCYRHVEFIAALGIAGGYPDGRYHPEEPCARDQMAAYIARAFALPL